MDRSIPKVGIILMAYNYGQYVNSVIKSLEQQTFQDFEVFLIDDGSNDGKTPKILEELQYIKITKKHLYKDNIGTARRQLQQYNKIKNKYILILCADDKLAPTFLEKTVKYMEKHPKCGAVGTDMICFYDDKNIKESITHFDQKFTIGYIAGNGSILGSSLMRKKALDETDLSGGFVRYQDWDRWVSMLEAGWTLECISEPLFYYRQHPKSLYHSASIEDEMDIRRKMLVKHKKTYQKNYEEIILRISRNFLEIQKSKNWLENQYYALNKEIERLNSVLKELEQKYQDELREREKFKIFTRLYRKIKYQIKQKKK